MAVRFEFARLPNAVDEPALFRYEADRDSLLELSKMAMTAANDGYANGALWSDDKKIMLYRFLRTEDDD